MPGPLRPCQQTTNQCPCAWPRAKVNTWFAMMVTDDRDLDVALARLLGLWP